MENNSSISDTAKEQILALLSLRGYTTHIIQCVKDVMFFDTFKSHTPTAKT